MPQLGQGLVSMPYIASHSDDRPGNDSDDKRSGGGVTRSSSGSDETG
ncbi:hypothetical protein AB0G71_07975 [Streptomyces sp. NPDC020403]